MGRPSLPVSVSGGRNGLVGLESYSVGGRSADFDVSDDALDAYYRAALDALGGDEVAAHTPGDDRATRVIEVAGTASVGLRLLDGLRRRESGRELLVRLEEATFIRELALDVLGAEGFIELAKLIFGNGEGFDLICQLASRSTISSGALLVIEEGLAQEAAIQVAGSDAGEYFSSLITQTSGGEDLQQAVWRSSVGRMVVDTLGDTASGVSYVSQLATLQEVEKSFARESKSLPVGFDEVTRTDSGRRLMRATAEGISGANTQLASSLDLHDTGIEYALVAKSMAWSIIWSHAFGVGLQVLGYLLFLADITLRTQVLSVEQYGAKSSQHVRGLTSTHGAVSEEREQIRSSVGKEHWTALYLGWVDLVGVGGSAVTILAAAGLDARFALLFGLLLGLTSWALRARLRPTERE